MGNTIENGRDRMKALINFLSNILFDTDTPEQFFKKYEKLGIVEDKNENTN